MSEERAEGARRGQSDRGEGRVRRERVSEEEEGRVIVESAECARRGQREEGERRK